MGLISWFRSRFVLPRQAGGVGGSAESQQRTRARLAALPEASRRELAVALQRRGRGLRSAAPDREMSVLLAELPCAWQPEDVRQLLRPALDGVDPDHPTQRWDAAADTCLLLPLAALRALEPSEREEFHPQLRTVLTVIGCTDGEPATAADRTRLAAELRGMLPPLPLDVDALLPPADPYAAAVRRRLGSALYQPHVQPLLDLCARPTDVRPPYEWLGRAGELLGLDTELRVVLRELLAAAVADGTRAPAFGARSGQLLGALAWAACVSQDVKAIGRLHLAAAGHARTALDELDPGPAHFVRAALAALAALTGAPGSGQHRRLLADPNPAVRRAAQQALGELHDLPAGFDPRALKVPAGPYTALFEVSPTGGVQLLFRNERGRRLAGVPARVRERHPARYAALRAQLGVLQQQSDRYRGTLDEYWATGLPVPAARWLAAFEDRPALFPMVTALVWQAELPSRTVLGQAFRPRNSATWALRDLHRALHELSGDTPVSLWRPDAAADRDLVAAWRAALRRRGVREQAVPQLAGEPRS
ncbi:DUF4132 domain-containing protein [Kitasatospora sp. NPDC058965]|uniref:DUF4132 domain-containing protein n=1 Tax=Kitasatospora sp. NPDC058965 TaxID=3346682 RepID=UPI0036926102